MENSSIVGGRRGVVCRYNCDPCLSAVYLGAKRRYINTLPFLFFIVLQMEVLTAVGERVRGDFCVLQARVTSFVRSTCPSPSRRATSSPS